MAQAADIDIGRWWHFATDISHTSYSYQCPAGKILIGSINLYRLASYTPENLYRLLDHIPVIDNLLDC